MEGIHAVWGKLDKDDDTSNTQVLRVEKIKEIFQGKDTDFSVAVCLNAAAGLLVAGKSNTFSEGYQKLREHILSGKVINHISKLAK